MRSCRLPNHASPFVCFAEELKRCERMTGIAFDAQYLGNYLQLLTIFALNFQPYPTSNVR